MTDVALPRSRSLDLTSDAARARIRARYRAEARFKLYGLVAIGLTAAFLAVVLADIVIKGAPAFIQHELVMDVTVDPDAFDKPGSTDPDVVRAGDYQRMVREALRARFPDVTERARRRKLDGLLSSGAADVLRERVVANPALIGQTVTVPVLLSDDADLYYKGGSTAIDQRPGRGTAVPSGTSGEITIASTANDFAAELAAFRDTLSVRARELRTEAARLRQHVGRSEARRRELEQAQRTPALEAELASVSGEIESLSARAQELESEANALQARFDRTGGDEPLDDTVPSLLVALNKGVVRVTNLSGNEVAGTVLIPLVSAADAAPGTWRILTYETAEANRRVSDQEVAWLERLREDGVSRAAFNWSFFTSGDSREAELAGIRGALVGSALTLLVTLVICLPLGVGAAIYLEEFAPKNRVTELIEVNINNLAAVPSIVFGLLGLAVFLNFFALPRSAPLVGGLVLALLVLPTIIIASRAALKAVPPSIKEAALGIGASQQQAIFHHVLPLAMPGIMTGTIIGMAHALGETAPLLMIGMVAFIVETPLSITDAATVLPVQIYLWSDLPEIAFRAKTAAAIMVLLVFLFVMNGAAIVLRKRFERRW
jgi:phosphate transport system permease protein